MAESPRPNLQRATPVDDPRPVLRPRAFRSSRLDTRAIVAGVPLVIATAVEEWKVGESSAEAAFDEGAGPLAVLAMPYGAALALSLGVGFVAALARRGR